MWRHAVAAPTTFGAKLRLGALILGVWFVSVHRNLVEQTGRLPITNALDDGRYVRAAFLASGHFLLRPGLVIREVRRVIGERPSKRRT
jgi:hypothetical protein